MNKKAFKILIILALFVSLFSFSPLTPQAAKKSFYVNVTPNSSLTVRSGPGTKYKKVGSLKTHTKIIVYRTTKSGWSEIRNKKKKAYVSSKYLIDKNVKKSRATYILKDINGKRYTVYVLGSKETQKKATADEVWAGAIREIHYTTGITKSTCIKMELKL